ncbi:MAG: hypothetical protein ABSH20_25355 [Tepidisphaeraceae bacterium]
MRELARVQAPVANKRPEIQLPDPPVLRFTPTAWAKLQCFCHCGDTEIGGFGITSAEDLLLVEDFQTVQQAVTSVSVAFDDTAVADFFEDQVDQGRKPEQFARIWLHTHPGNSPTPSFVDEETFARVFGKCDWAVMFVLAKGGKTYARLRFNVGPGGHLLIPVEVEYQAEFGPSDHEAWQLEYDINIHPESLVAAGLGSNLKAAKETTWPPSDQSTRDFGFFEELDDLRGFPDEFREYEVYP